jgi:uncharacterized protein (TIGR01777 family)
MKVIVSGASGLIGNALIPALKKDGHSVQRLVRTAASSPEEISWNPEAGTIDRKAMENADAVVHLAGENIAEGKWTPEKKARIKDSRQKGTTLLSRTLAELEHPPKVLVSASAIGYYGDRGEEILREDSGPGVGFLSEACQEWEHSTQPASEKGIRVVILRIGIVLSPKGGALKKMLPPFKMGAGGKLGTGDQFMSWIALDDLVSIMQFAMATETMSGPFNAVSPNPVTNLEYTKTLGKVLMRPTLFSMPSFVVHALFGELGDALLLASTRVHPAKLITASYPFRYPELEGALRHLLAK